HHRHACRAYVEAAEDLALPRDHVPQLAEVTRRLEPRTGFRYLPVAGLAPLRAFYASFADSSFYSTQYLRHPSLPLYTPEPDIVHEVVGHANQLACPELAAIYREVGDAVHRTTTDPALRFLSRVFWFTMEFGVVWEDGEPKAYGAGILSSYGETSTYRGADIRALDIAEMGALPYDITHYQPVLYAARSMTHLVDALTDFYSSYDDEVHGRLTHSHPEAT
ncbi:MAG: phenylalanine 4-monooxygenase, partial [Acidimicrobiales bacterium]